MKTPAMFEGMYGEIFPEGSRPPRRIVLLARTIGVTARRVAHHPPFQEFADGLRSSGALDTMAERASVIPGPLGGVATVGVRFMEYAADLHNVQQAPAVDPHAAAPVGALVLSGAPRG